MKTVKSLKSLDLSCDNTNSRLSQVKAVEQILQIESSEQINDTLTKEELKTAGEMFLYLTMCPDTIKPWLLFYKDLLLTQSPVQIILTLNRVMKKPRTQANTNKYFKKLSEILFKRIISKVENTALNTEARPPQTLLKGIL